jgi:hypothetical protein
MKFNNIVNEILREARKSEEDGNEFIKKIADAAKRGEKTAMVGGKKISVKMSKDKADKIEGGGMKNNPFVKKIGDRYKGLSAGSKKK